MKTYMANSQTVEREWYVVDGAGQPLGRLASQVASVLRGKHKPTFTPNADAGDYVIILNSDKVILTGKKMEQKIKWRHSGHLGGLKEIPFASVMANSSDRAVHDAVKGMLPKNSLGRKMIKKLKVYKDDKHEHKAQMPVEFKLTEKRYK